MYSEYETECKNIVNNQNLFDKFRTNNHIKIIIETVSENYGKSYIQELEKINPLILTNSLLMKLDAIGSPSKIFYNGLSISPTFARYLHQVSLLEVFFNKLSGMKIVEIGGGFGGHSCVLNTYISDLASYSIIDLPSVAMLIKKYINTANLSNKITVYNNNEPSTWENNKYDILISHYCFSEIDSKFQDIYLNKVIKNTPRGFMICNYINIKSHSRNKIIQLIKTLHPSLIIYEERPLTHPGNYIITWDDTKPKILKHK